MQSDMELYLEKVIKRTNPKKYIEILEQDREDFAKVVNDLQEDEDKILNEIYNFCNECGSHLNCPEDECVLYRIEQIVLGGEKDE